MDNDEQSESIHELARAIAKSAETVKLRELREMARRTLLTCNEAERAGVQMFIDECSAELVRRDVP